MTCRLQAESPLPRHVVAEVAALGGLADGLAHALDGERILGADVEERLVRADGVRGDGEPLEDAVRVRFEHHAVHERAGVALVAVHDDVLLRRGLAADGGPLCAGRKPAPPRPRRPESSMIRMTASGESSRRHFSSAS